MTRPTASAHETTEGKAARYGTVTTTWRREQPGLWVGTRDGKTLTALHLVREEDEGIAGPVFVTLEEARAAATRVEAPPVIFAASRSRSGWQDRLVGTFQPVGALLINALRPPTVV